MTQEYLVYIDEDYYPSAEIVTAVSPQHALMVAKERVAWLDNGPLAIAVPLRDYASNETPDNEWRWDQLRDADR